MHEENILCHIKYNNGERKKNQKKRKRNLKERNTSKKVSEIMGRDERQELARPIAGNINRINDVQGRKNKRADFSISPRTSGGIFRLVYFQNRKLEGEYIAN